MAMQNAIHWAIVLTICAILYGYVGYRLWKARKELAILSLIIAGVGVPLALLWGLVALVKRFWMHS
jgi:hypothetical protein